MKLKDVIREIGSINSEVLPSLEQIRFLVDKHLRMSNTVDFDRDKIVDRLAGLIHGWAKKLGMKRTLDLMSTFIISEENGHKTNEYRDNGSNERTNDSNHTNHGEESTGVTGSEGGTGERDNKGIEVIELSSGCSGTNDKEGISRKLLELELEEHTIDLKVFTQAYDLINSRVVTVKDEGRLMKLVEWSGTTAVLCTLELVIHNIERVVAEIKELITKIDSGELTNID